MLAALGTIGATLLPKVLSWGANKLANTNIGGKVNQFLNSGGEQALRQGYEQFRSFTPRKRQQEREFNEYQDTPPNLGEWQDQELERNPVRPKKKKGILKKKRKRVSFK